MNKHQQKIVIMFLLPIYILGILKFVWPNKDISASENRKLQQMPKLTWQSLYSGSFSKDFESWFTDQFPFRDTFIEADRQIKSLMQVSLPGDNVTLIQGPGNDLGIGENLLHEGENLQQITSKPDSGQAVLGKPDRENDLNNTQQPNPTTDVKPEEKNPDPDDSATAQTNNDDKTNVTEKEITDQTNVTEPQETQPAPPPPGVDAPVENYSAVIIVNQVAMELYGFNQAKADYYAGLINNLQTKTPNSQVYSLLAPTSIEFYSPEKYHTLTNSQKSAISYTYGQLQPAVKSVDAYSKLAANWQEYIYFRSDHHWTALGAYYAYQAFAQSAGFEPVTISQLTQGTIPGDFLGSLYRYTQSPELKKNPDTVSYYEPQVAVTGKAYADAAMNGGYSIELIKKSVGANSQYLAFIEGDHALAHFNTSVKNGRKVIVIKESYGNAFVPYLASHYEDIYVVDPRRVNMNLPQFINDNGINDTIVINYTFAASNPTWIEGFARMIG